MTTAQDRAIAAGLSATRRVTGRTIRYSRGATSLSFRAIPGSTDWSAQTDYAVTNAWQSRDFLFPLSEISSLDSPTPAKGDLIDEIGNDEITRRYQVMSPAGAQHYRLMDPGRQWARVHTKLIDSNYAT